MLRFGQFFEERACVCVCVCVRVCGPRFRVMEVPRFRSALAEGQRVYNAKPTTGEYTNYETVMPVTKARETRTTVSVPLKLVTDGVGGEVGCWPGQRAARFFLNPSHLVAPPLQPATSTINFMLNSQHTDSVSAANLSTCRY